MKKLLLTLVFLLGWAGSASAQPCATCQVVGQDIGVWVAGLTAGKLTPSQLPAATTVSLGAVSVSTGLTVNLGALSVTYGTAAGTAAQGNDSRITGACQTSGCTFSGAVAMGANQLSGSNAVFTGGTVNGVVIGGTTPAAGSFTTLGASGTVSGAGFTSLLSPYALLASPAFTGTPTAPTASAATNTTQLATTANVVTTIEAPPTAGYGATTAEPVNATTINASGVITPSGGVAGSTTGTSPAAGYVGQVIKGSATGLALSASTITNLTSVSLTPGNYICMGGFNVGTVGSGATNYQAFLTTTSASFTGLVEPAYNVLNLLTANLGSANVFPTGAASVLATSTETLYLDGFSTVATTGSAGYLTCVRIQ